MKKLTLLLLLLLVTLLACGPAPAENGGNESPVTEGDATTSEETTDTVAPTFEDGDAESVIATFSDELLAQLPDLSNATARTTAEGLTILTYQTGDGTFANTGDTVQAHYSGYTEDGNQFDSSRDRGATFDFPLGQGQVIPGWDIGFGLLQPGERAVLVIPSDLGYGEQGAGADIPPNATLYFDVELVDVVRPRQPIEVSDDDYQEIREGLRYAVMQEGSGDAVADGQIALIDFALWDAATFELYGDSAQSGQPLGFELGGDLMFAALQDSVRGMQVGEQRQIFMASTELTEAGLPPGTDVIFEVELVEIGEAGPSEPSVVDSDNFEEIDSGIEVSEVNADGETITQTAKILYQDIVVGDGKVLEEGDTVTIHYTAFLEGDGSKFDSSYDRGTPLEFPVGFAQIPGFNEALPGATVGTTRQIIVPASVIGDIGLGEPQAIIFEVTILDALVAVQQ